jgi:hypothetical protein
LSLNAKYSDLVPLVEFWNNGASSIVDDFEKLEMPKDLKSAFDILQIIIS